MRRYSTGAARPLTALAVTVVLSAAFGPPVRAIEFGDTGTTRMVSLSTSGSRGNRESGYPSTSADGRYIAFTSESPLVADDSNNTADVFVRDTVANTTARVSVATDGAEADGMSVDSAISANGRYVAFYSTANNLVAGDTNDAYDVFIRDMVANATTRVSIATDGTQGDAESYGPTVSSDGRYVAFYSYASTLVAGGDTNTYDVFVRDTVANTTSSVSMAADGTQADSDSFDPAISSDGRYIAFHSYAGNLVSGRDNNNSYDVFVRDTVANTTTQLTVATDGAEPNGDSSSPTISADGRHVAFYSSATNLVTADTNGAYDAFVHDTATSTTTRVSTGINGSQANGDTFGSAISGDGRHIAFPSYASNLVAGDTNALFDVFVRDTVADTTTRMSLASDGMQGDDHSTAPTLSADGRHVAFFSLASNLVSRDGNGVTDVFVRTRAVSGSVTRSSCSRATVVGTSDAETLRGTIGPDVIDARGGNDTIFGLGGDDLICAGWGADTVYAGDGNDIVYADAGDDSVSGGPGQDRCYGGDGTDAATSCERRSSVP